MTLEHWTDLVRRRIEGRRFLVTAPVLASVHGKARQLLALGARSVFGIAGSPGTAPGEPPEGFEGVVLGVQGSGMMGGIRETEAALGTLPPEVLARVDRFDPEGTARVVGPLFAVAPTVAGRRLLGARPQAWQALEDKCAIDGFWDAAAVDRAPAAVVEADFPALWGAHRRLDRGAGTVWVADNRDGFHGAAAMLRWVRTEEEGRAAAAFLADNGGRARVMPFLDGVPCSVHGIVFDDYVVALRPMEMMVLRRTGSSRLLYAKAASFWDPAPADREAMREVARKTGRRLRGSVGYRGVFTVDGVMTAEGFLPTELNPRFGAALVVMLSRQPELPLYLLHLLVADGADEDWRPRQLEAALLAAADAERAASAGVLVEREVQREERLELVLDGGWRAAWGDERPAATAVLGPAGDGGIVFLKLAPERTPVGPPTAPRVAGALGFLDEVWGLGLGPLEAAPQVR